MSLADVVADYCAAWCEPDALTRQRLLDRCWADDAIYCDPMSRAVGREALMGLIGGYHDQYAGARIVQTSAIDEHDQTFRFTWSFVDGAGVTQIEGIDFGTVGDDGRLTGITGFFGPVPPLASG